MQIHSLKASVAAMVLAIAVSGCNKGPSTNNDATVAQDVQGRISQDSSLQGQPIAINAKDGVVTLSGTVQNDAARQAAATDASAAEGVRTVVNNLTVSDTTAAQQQPPAP